MTSETREDDRAIERARDRAAGRAWLVAGLASIVLMAFHPVGQGGELPKVVASLVAIAQRDRLVHGALIAALGVSALGWWQLFQRLDPRSTATRLAACAVLLGSLGYMAAALVNGFVVPALAERYADLSGAELEPLRADLRLTWALNQVCGKLGVLAFGVGFLCTGLALRRRGIATVLGGCAIAFGALLVAGAASGHLRLHLHAMLVIVLLQAAWNVAAALLLQRGRFVP